MNLIEAEKEKRTFQFDDPVSPESIMVDIEGIHAYPAATRNYTRYMTACLQQSVPTWTRPYRRPLIKHHNEVNGDIIGRICAVEYKTADTLSGTPALLFTVNIPGMAAKKDVQDGLLETVSIGIIAHDVRCSICGHQIAEEGQCVMHERGQIYENEICYWDVYRMEAKELSYVVVPSDIFAKNRAYYPATQSKPGAVIQENMQGGIILDPKEKEINDLKEKIAALEAEKKTLVDANADLAAEKANQDKAIVALKETNIALATKNTELEAEKRIAATTVEQEKQMRETLEGEMAVLKERTKKDLAESVQLLRKATGKIALSEAVIASRSEDSLRDAVNDLKAELNEVLPVPGSVISPGLSETRGKESVLHVKEKLPAGNIDLEKGLQDLFNTVANAHR